MASSVTLTSRRSIDSVYVNEDEKISLSGPDGDSYIIYNPVLERLELWNGGVLKQIW